MNFAINTLKNGILREYENVTAQNTVIAKTGDVMDWRIKSLKESRRRIHELRKAIRILEALSIDDIKVEQLKNEN